MLSGVDSLPFYVQMVLVYFVSFVVNIASFSAVCWLFAKNVYNRVQRPMGLIDSAWGGTRIEAWSSPDANYECFGDEGPPYV